MVGVSFFLSCSFPELGILLFQKQLIRLVGFTVRIVDIITTVYAQSLPSFHGNFTVSAWELHNPGTAK